MSVLRYRPVRPSDLAAFHGLATDTYIRRFLLDGQHVTRAWSEAAIQNSQQRFHEHGVGLWLLYEANAQAAGPIGFAGFWVFEELGPQLQLIYALREPFTGKGYGLRAAVELIDFARWHAGFGPIESSVDAPNTASRRILEALGFEHYAQTPGRFGPIAIMRLAAHRPPRVLVTKRLVLRPWQDTDLAAFAALNADARVMQYFPAPLEPTASDHLAHTIRTTFAAKGYGRWGVELPQQAHFIGFVGLSHPDFDSHFTPCMEISWRLAAAHWGAGYATEAAHAALRAAFVHLSEHEVVAFTAAINGPSRRVMEKLGMQHDPREDFDHPRLPSGHHLRRHVLYRIRRSQWISSYCSPVTRSEPSASGD